jgi:polyhydroxyalkanoate synthesis regulator phasin
MDGLKGLVEKGDLTIEQARARFLELLEKQLIGEGCSQ